MAIWIIPGLFLGLAFAYYTTVKSQKNVKEKLVSDFEIHSKKGTFRDYIYAVIDQKALWIKSLSLVRKPFGKQANLAIETVALAMVCIGLINSISGFERYFHSTFEGVVVIIFLSALMSYIPGDWFFTGRMEKQVSAVLDELKDAVDKDNSDLAIARIKRDLR